MKIMSYKEYINAETSRLRNTCANELEKTYYKTNSPKKLKKIRQTEEYKKRLRETMESTPQYLLLMDPKYSHDKYDAYVKQKEKEQQEENRKVEFFKDEMVPALGGAEKCLEIFLDDIRGYFKKEEIHFVTDIEVEDEDYNDDWDDDDDDWVSGHDDWHPYAYTDRKVALSPEYADNLIHYLVWEKDEAMDYFIREAERQYTIDERLPLENMFEDIVYDFLLEKNLIEESNGESNRSWDAFTETLHPIGEEYAKQVPCFFSDPQNIIDLIKDNPHHKDCVPALSDALKKEMLVYETWREKCRIEEEKRREKKRRKEERKKQEEKLYKEMLETIPDDLTLLYPKARAIKRKFFLHVGPTNSGKTHDALRAFQNADHAVYLAPLRLLACEVAERMNANGVPCSLITGEEENLIEGATHVSSTIEMLSLTEEYNVAVIDECQMVEDKERGGSWTRAILGIAAKEIHLCLAPDAADIVRKLIRKCGDEYDGKIHERSVPLEVESGQFSFPKDVREGDALVVFSKRAVLHCAQVLKEKGFPCSVVYGALPYQVRKEETRRFLAGETKAVVCTDAIGMGMNLPVKRVVFLELQKFDGTTVRWLKSTEIKQIAGRAGRYGMFEKGTVSSEYDRKRVRNALSSNIKQIEQARIGFPETLLALDGKVSTIYKKWNDISVDPIYFSKANVTREMELAVRLESKTDDKKLIYSFVTIPFDEKNTSLLSIWKNMFNCAIAGTVYDFQKPMYSTGTLESMETAYAVCDLYYAYERRFASRRDILNEITKMKEHIADEIAEYLKTKKLPKRRCKYCGKILPWNYGYGMCAACHNKRYPSYGYRDSYYW